MQDFLHKKILLGVCGGIGAYKVAYLIRELVRLGAEVRVVMTENAKEFITPLTLQALSGFPVRDALFDVEAERGMSHIELARWADYVLIAPASANLIAKLAVGLADDLLSTLLLVAEVPVFIAPAMNQSMWAHPATVHNVTLIQSRGVTIIGPAEGSQACGEFGFGRLSEVDDIIDSLRLHGIQNSLKNKRILITAGPTREYIDPVRYLSNNSSGKMGIALAKAFQFANAEVTLICGPTAQPLPHNITVIPTQSALDMASAVETHLSEGMIFVATAAVCDYTIAAMASHKIKKSNQAQSLTLLPTVDILATVATTQKASYVVGFAAETKEVEYYAQQKLTAKKVDMIIANEVGNGKGFDSDYNEVTIITKDEMRAIPLMHKTRLAANIVQCISEKLASVTEGIS